MLWAAAVLLLLAHGSEFGTLEVSNAFYASAETSRDANGWMRASLFRLECGVKIQNPADPEGPNDPLPFSFVVDLGSSHTVMNWKEAEKLAIAADTVPFYDPTKNFWVKAVVLISPKDTPSLITAASVHVPWSVPPDYKDFTGELVELAIGADVLMKASWCMTPTKFLMDSEWAAMDVDGTVSTHPCQTLGVPLTASPLLTLPIPGDGDGDKHKGSMKAEVSVRTGFKEWKRLTFALCTGAELTAFHAEDALYVEDEDLGYTETVKVAGEEMNTKGFACNVAIGGVVVTARCARMLHASEDRCLGRDVLSRFVLSHQPGDGFVKLFEASKVIA